MQALMAPVDVIREEDGGTLILTCRSGQRARRAHIWKALWAQPIYDLIGAATPRYDVLYVGVDSLTGELEAAIPAPAGARILAGSRTNSPGGVAVRPF
jgi:hypothetical protein